MRSRSSARLLTPSVVLLQLCILPLRTAQAEPAATPQITLGEPQRPTPTSTVIDPASLELVTESTHLALRNIALSTEHIYLSEPYTPNKGRLSLQLQALIGAITLTSRTDPDINAFTWNSGLGARIVYGLTKRLSLEATLSYLTSGTATLQDDTTAQRVTGRMLLGVAGHLGTKYVTSARFGAGLRLSNYTYGIGDNEDTDLQLNGVFSFGFGFDAWLSKRFVVGFFGNYVGPWGTGDESFGFELAVHTGFSWDVPYDDW